MKLDDFLLLEFKDSNKAKFDFWVDEFGNIRLDIGDDESVMDYIKRYSDLLSKEYKHKIDNRKAKDLDPEEVIKKMGWSRVVLNGKNEAIHFKGYEKNGKKIPPRDINNPKYDYAIIYVPGLHDPKKKDKDDNINIIVDRIRKIYPTIMRVRSIDRNHCVKEILLKEPKNEPKRKFNGKKPKPSNF